MKKLIATLMMVVASQTIAADLTGAGATFPYPIYAKWAEAYKAATGIGLNYQSIGSGGGIRQIKAKTVDFGASDMPLKPEELEKEGLMQFPAIIGGVVPVFNIDGIEPGQVKLISGMTKQSLNSIQVSHYQQLILLKCIVQMVQVQHSFGQTI